VHVAVVRPSVYSRSACLPSPSPVPPLQPGCNYWCARVALAAIHHARARARARRRPISPDRERSRVRSVRSGRFSLKVLSNCRWGKEEGTGSDRALFCPLFPPAIKKNWIKGFAPLAKQIRRDPSWPPLRSGLGGINCAPPLPRLPYDTQRQLQHSTAKQRKAGRRYQTSVKPSQRVCLWSLGRSIGGSARRWPWQWRSKRASPARLPQHGESSRTRAGECVCVCLYLSVQELRVLVSILMDVCIAGGTTTTGGW
jgi:hypothetical protein